MKVSKLVFVVALLEAILWAQPNLCMNNQQSLNEVLSINNEILKSLDETGCFTTSIAKLSLVRIPFFPPLSSLFSFFPPLSEKKKNSKGKKTAEKKKIRKKN